MRLTQKFKTSTIFKHWLELYGSDVIRLLGTLAIPRFVDSKLFEYFLNTLDSSHDVKSLKKELLQKPIWTFTGSNKYQFNTKFRKLLLDNYYGDFDEVNKFLKSTIDDSNNTFKSTHEALLADVLMSNSKYKKEGVNLSQKLYNRSFFIRHYDDRRILAKYTQERFDINKIISSNKSLKNYEVKACYIIGTHCYSIKKYNKALKYLEIVSDNHQKIDEKSLSIATHFIGCIHIKRRDFDHAEPLLIKSLHYSDGDTIHQAQVYHTLGRLYIGERNFDKAISMLKRSLRNDQQCDNTYGCAKVYHSLGNLYKKKNRHIDSFQNYSNALEICQEYKYTDLEAKILNSIAATLVKTLKKNDRIFKKKKQYIFGEIQKRWTQRYELAKSTIDDSLAINKLYHNSEGTAYAYKTLGDLYSLKSDKRTMAIDSYKNALHLTNNRFLRSASFLHIGEIYHSLHKFDKAIKYYEQALTHEKSPNYIKILKQRIRLAEERKTVQKFAKPQKKKFSHHAPPHPSGKFKKNHKKSRRKG